MPIGMQIAGAAFDEATVLRAAHAYEQDAKWFERRPAM
jgi:aspartyl-tRNA(Asn)/glutamyl-tRNA(Gln) amidotransferase subunit A